MRRTLLGAFTVMTVLAAVVSVSGQAAQSKPSIGTWKLNLAKSKYDPPNLAPKSQTAKVEVAGSGVKHTREGIAWNGSRIAYEYTINYDGKDYPITGTGTPNGADTIAATRIDANTFDLTLKKAGKVVQTNREVYSSTLRTITAKGTDESGQPTNNVIVYDRQ